MTPEDGTRDPSIPRHTPRSRMATLPDAAEERETRETRMPNRKQQWARWSNHHAPKRTCPCSTRMLPDQRIEMVGVEINIQRNHIQTRKFASLRIEERCLAVDVFMVDDYGGFGQSCNRPEPYSRVPADPLHVYGSMSTALPLSNVEP